MYVLRHFHNQGHTNVSTIKFPNLAYVPHMRDYMILQSLCMTPARPL